jgi:hypothetical protein
MRELESRVNGKKGRNPTVLIRAIPIDEAGSREATASRSQSHRTDQGNSDDLLISNLRGPIPTSQSHRTDQGNSDAGPCKPLNPRRLTCLFF